MNEVSHLRARFTDQAYRDREPREPLLDSQGTNVIDPQAIADASPRRIVLQSISNGTNRAKLYGSTAMEPCLAYREAFQEKLNFVLNSMRREWAEKTVVTIPAGAVRDVYLHQRDFGALTRSDPHSPDVA